MPRDLEALREEIAEADRALLDLLRRRLELAAAVGRVKAAQGLPVVAHAVEDRILARARRHAEACGVSEEAMEAVFRAILRASVERQHRMGAAERSRRGARVLVVGGGGAMGGWFRRFLTENGHAVEACDPAWEDPSPRAGRFRSLEEVEELDAYDVILISVPLGQTAEVLARTVQRRPRGLVVEIASIKAHLSETLAAATEAGVRVASLHPMFGPAKARYEPMTFVLACRDDFDAELAGIEPLLRHPYTKLVPVPFDHHDRLMGWLLGLAHLTGMLFGAALAASDLEASELRACASTTFLRQAATARSVLAEDPDLYLDIQRLNPHREEVYTAAREALEGLAGLVRREDREGFRRRLAEARRAVTGAG